ncbi:MAG: aldo/keto reductase [Candidatus Sumerlaeia bacterium]
MINKRTFGRMGWEVTELGLGAWAIGGSGYGEVDDKIGEETLETYLDMGGNFIDTAHLYGNSEELIGNVLKRRGGRENLYICSKSPGGASEDKLDLIREHVELSLKRMGTDYVDLYYLHSPPEDADLMNRALDIYDELKSEGKVMAVAASIKGPAVTDATTELCRQYIDTGRIDAIQLIYSILRQKNAEIFDYAQEKGVALVARTSIESGFLSGKYKPGVNFKEGKGWDHRGRWDQEQLAQILEKVQELEGFAVQPPYEGLAQVAIRFALESPQVSACIPGAKNPEQVKKNMAVAELPPLDSELVKKLRTEYSGLEDLVN